MPQNTLQSPKSRTERNRERMKNYRLYLVRHGITAGNLQRRYVGGGTDEPLCEPGPCPAAGAGRTIPLPLGKHRVCKPHEARFGHGRGAFLRR